MPVHIEANKGYDPIKFLKNNIHKIIPPDSFVQKISFSGFKRKAFHSNKRPKGVITISYKDELSEKELHLFVKQHSNALKVFNHISNVCSRFDTSNTKSHIPKPIICDGINDVNFMEYVNGASLTHVVVRQLFLHRGKQLKATFRRIGKWLNNYHGTSKLDRNIPAEIILEQIHTELEKTSFFNDTEKAKVSTHLKNKNLKNKSFELVTPHNDFALRNVIYLNPTDFKIIDWDAIYHEKFTTETPIWNDITSFIISLQSLQRFSPLVSKRQIKFLIKSFLKGYFKNYRKAPRKKEIKNILYIFFLSYYLGIIGDRPLPEIYKEKFGYRYIDQLRKNLVNGYSI